jgi:hypothetical protein
MARRTVIVMLALVLLGIVLRIVVQVHGGPAAATRAIAAPRAAQTTAPAGLARQVVGSLGAVERAFDAGNVRRLCRPGVLVDPAVIRQQDVGTGDCESELEALVSSHAPLRLAVRQIAARPDLATVTVTAADGAGAAVDLVRHGDRWLLSFSDGDDPMPALAGVA